MKTMDEIILESQQLPTLHPPVPTGFVTLDGQTSLLRRGLLTLLAGRPRIGKTTFAAQTVLNVAKRGGTGAFFSLDESSSRLVERLMEIEGGAIPKGLSLYFDDRTANIKRMKDTLYTLGNTPDLIVVDYLQLFYWISRRGKSHLEPGRICWELKNLALSMNAAVLCISRISRAQDWRFGHFAQITDIPQWDVISPYADTVCHLCRNGYYDELRPGEIDVLVFEFFRHTDPRRHAEVRWESKGYAVDQLSHDG